MPQVVTGAATFLASTGPLAVLTKIAIGQGLSILSSKLISKDRPKGISLTDHQHTVRSAITHHNVLFGEAITSGPVAYANLSGPENRELWHDVVMVSHECDDLVSVIFDGRTPILKADIDWTAGALGADGAGSAAVSTAEFVGDNSATAVFLRYYLGHPDQLVSGQLDAQFADITAAFRNRGRAHLVSEIHVTEDTETVWKDGLPVDYKAVWRGKKAYDPRLDSTNGGTGSHRYTDETTWEWSDNPSLCIAYYLVTEVGADPAIEMDWPSFSAAADDCDVSVAIPGSTETRFTCNGVLSLGTSHKDNLDALVSSMAGKLNYVGDKWRVRAAVWEAASVSIDEDDFRIVNTQGSASKENRFNTIRGIFVDPTRGYTTADFPRVQNSTYITRDNNEVIPRDLRLPFTNSETMAQRIAYRVLNEGNNQIITTLKLNHRGAKIAVGDVVNITVAKYTWFSKSFRCIKWIDNNDGTFDITFREDSSASYDDPIEADYDTGVASTVTVPAPVVPQPTGLVADSIETGIRLSWSNPSARFWEWIDVYESGTDQWSAATLRLSTRSNSVDITYPAGTVRYFWVRARNRENFVGLRFPDSDTSDVVGTSGVLTIETPLVLDLADGSDTFPADTAPHIEGEGLVGVLNYTSPSNLETVCLVSWNGAVQISGATSGDATGKALIRIAIQVNSVVVYDKKVQIEGNTVAADTWGSLSGVHSLTVPAGQLLEVTISSGRDFTTTGVYPSQDHEWKNVLLTVTPQRQSVVSSPIIPPPPSGMMDGWPLVVIAMAISSGATRMTTQPTKEVIEMSNAAVDQGINFGTSSERATQITNFAALRVANPELIFIAHQDHLNILLDQGSTATYRWLEDQLYANPADVDEYLLRESVSGPYVTHVAGQGNGIAFNWNANNTVMERVAQGQLDQYTDEDGVNNLMPTYAIYLMHDTMPEKDFSRYRETVHNGTITAIESSTEIDIPRWTGVDADGSPDGSGYESLNSNSNFVCLDQNHDDGSYKNITGWQNIDGSTDRIRLSGALEMSDNAGDEFYIYETSGSSGGQSAEAAMSLTERLDGINNLFDRFEALALSEQGVAVDSVSNGGAVTYTKKKDGSAPAYPSAWIGKWGMRQIERICSFADGAGFFQYDYTDYRTALVGAGSSNIKDQDHEGRNYNVDDLMQCIEYNKLFLKSNASSASGYPGVWLNAQTRFFADYSNLTELDAAYARFWCCLAWSIENVYPQVEMDDLHQWPVAIDEQVIDAGNPITTRGFGTYDPLGSGGTGSFVFKTPDFGTYGYAFEFDNILIVINLRPPTTPGVWIPSWQASGQAIDIALDRYTVMGAGAGKKWQRIDRTTYVNGTVGSKFSGNGPTDYDTDAKIMGDTTLNDGTDVGVTIDVGALEAIMLLRVDV